MSILEQVNKLIASSQIDGANWAGFSVNARNLILPAFDLGNSADCSVDHLREQGLLATYKASNHLISGQMTPGAASLLLLVWNRMAEGQVALKKRADRARIAFELGKIHYCCGDRGSAAWWFMLAHAEDILGGHPNGGGSAKTFLRDYCGVSETAIQGLTKVSDKCRSEVKRLRGDWSSHVGFPEEAVRRFCSKDSDAIEMMQ